HRRGGARPLPLGEPARAVLFRAPALRGGTRSHGARNRRRGEARRAGSDAAHHRGAVEERQGPARRRRGGRGQGRLKSSPAPPARPPPGERRAAHGPGPYRSAAAEEPARPFSVRPFSAPVLACPQPARRSRRQPPRAAVLAFLVVGASLVLWRSMVAGPSASD